MRASSPIEGVYLHVPFCDGKCGYCAFYSLSGRTGDIDDYLDALELELEAESRLHCYRRRTAGSKSALARLGAGRPRPVDAVGDCGTSSMQAAVSPQVPLAPRTLYMGGGTPTILTVRQLARLCAIPARHLDLRRLKEWTVEANPGTLDAERLAVLKAAGVNRISLGVQSLDDAVLARLGRRHTAAQAREACALIRAAGFRNWSLDLIGCVPGVMARQWAETVRAAVALGPPHMSVYALTSEEGSRLAGQIAAGDAALLDEEGQLACLHTAEQLLRASGLRRYEISNYARPGFECRHNVSCWRGESYLGVGCAAASHANHSRWTNAPDLDAYLQAARAGSMPPREVERLTPETEAVERLIFGLRMAEGVEPAGILAALDARNASLPIGVGRRRPRRAVTGTQQARRGEDAVALPGGSMEQSALGTHWATTFARLRREGLVRTLGGRRVLTARGRDLADTVAVELMP